jgi:mannonate dehydratase
MRQCWRWFGPADRIPLADLHMVSVRGIVTALHHLLPGEFWTREEIARRKDLLAREGVIWDVVESLPVSKTIKTQGAELAAHLENYRVSLGHLAEQSIRTVCYNFMPILDWTRTELRAPQPHGGTATRFSLLDFAVFDLHLLARASAPEDYTAEQRDLARQHF